MDDEESVFETTASITFKLAAPTKRALMRLAAKRQTNISALIRQILLTKTVLDYQEFNQLHDEEIKKEKVINE